METTSKDGKKAYYTGYTNDLYRRWKEHRKGTGAKFCRGRHVELKFFETYTERKTAMKRELEIKSYTKQKKINLIDSFNKS